MRISDLSSDVCSSDLGIIVAGVHMEQGERHLARPERLDGEVQHDGRILAAGEQQRRPFELRGDLAQDVDRLAFEQEIGRASCRERVVQYVWTLVVADKLKKK